MAGTIKVNIGGELRPLKFGTNQSGELCRVRGISLAEMQTQLSNFEDGDGTIIRDLIYSALWAGCKTNKIDIDFDNLDLGDWIDEMDQDELAKVFETLVGSNESGAKKSKKK